MRDAPSHQIKGSLAVENLRQTYGALSAVDDVSLNVAPGEILCLLGASGCGKTTLLRLLAGVEQPTGGRIVLDGREIAGPRIFVPPEQRNIGLVFQDYALFPHMSVFDNVMFGLRQMPRGKAQELARRGLARVGLAHYAEKYPQLLSGGEQQRVALARALAPRPNLLLMDEPFSNLDQRLREQVREETIALLRDEGMSAIVVTHDPEEAMQMADRIALMRKGAIVQSGAAEDLYFRPQSLFAARFFCDFNEISAVIDKGCVTTPLGTFDASGMRDGPCIVCIRPQALQFDAPDGGATQATITARRFLGRVDRIKLRVAGMEHELHARLRDARAFRPGQSIVLGVDARDVVIFPQDTNQTLA